MPHPSDKEKTPLAVSLFRRQALVFLVTFVSSLIIFIFSLSFIFQTIWDQATQSIRLEIERQADTIARLLVFEFSHLKELEAQNPPDREANEQLKRRLWEKVTFNETIQGIELIRGQENEHSQHLTYSYIPLNRMSSESELGPQMSMKTFSGPEGDLIRIINSEQRVDKNILDSINRGRKIESELLWRYFPLYIPLPDQGAVYWGVTKVGIRTDSMRRFLILLENEKADLRRSLILTMGLITAVAMALGLLGSKFSSRRITGPLEDYEIMNNALKAGSGIDADSLLTHLHQQDRQGISEFDQIQNFCLRLGGTIKLLGEKVIETERQACLGRLAARLVQSGKAGRMHDFAELFNPLPEQWRQFSLEPYLEQTISLLTAILPEGSFISEREKIPSLYGSEANLVQAVLFLVDFVLNEMPVSGRLHWNVLPLENGGIKLIYDFSGRKYTPEEIFQLLKPFKSLNEISLPLGPYLAAAIAKQQGGELIMLPNVEGGLSLRLELPDHQSIMNGESIERI